MFTAFSQDQTFAYLSGICDSVFAGQPAAYVKQHVEGFIENYLSTRQVKHLNQPAAAPIAATRFSAPAAPVVDPDAKYEAEYLAEKQACDDYGISRELFVYSCKMRDGVDCEYPAAK